MSIPSSVQHYALPICIFPTISCAGIDFPDNDLNMTADHDQAAAVVIQNGYRRHVASRTRAGRYLSKSASSNTKQQSDDAWTPEKMGTDDRWNSAMKEGAHRDYYSEQKAGKNDASARWNRSAFYAGRIGGSSSNGSEQEGTGSKQMESAYWLEMLDSKQWVCPHLPT